MSEYEKLEMQAFESEFNQLIQESTQNARKKDTLSNIQSQQASSSKREILIPIAQIKNKLEQQQLAAPQKVGGSNSDNMVHFALVTKGKGNKAQVKQIEVPADASIAVRNKERQRAEQEERGRVKEQIMKMTQQQILNSASHEGEGDSDGGESSQSSEGGRLGKETN